MMRKRGHAVTIVVGYAVSGRQPSSSSSRIDTASPRASRRRARPRSASARPPGSTPATIHRLIYHAVEDPKTGLMSYKRRTPDEIEMMLPRSRLLVLDESSMVGPDVWRDVIAVAQQHDLKLVCIGDGFQLPPVQPPNSPPFSILAPDFAAQLGAERVELTEVLRQAQDSPIIRASMLLRQRKGIYALNEIQKIEREQIATTCLAVHQQRRDHHLPQERDAVQGQRRAPADARDHRRDAAAGRAAPVPQEHVRGRAGERRDVAVPRLEVVPSSRRRSPTGRSRASRSWPTSAPIKINGKNNAVLAVEELHGRLTLSMKAISTIAAKWARRENLYCGDAVAPHVAANFGYAFTAHKSQGSAWPYVFVILEPSIRLSEEEGSRWVYTAVDACEFRCRYPPRRILMTPLRQTQIDHAACLISILHPAPSAQALIEITAMAGRNRPVKRYFTDAALAVEFALEFDDMGFSSS